MERLRSLWWRLITPTRDISDRDVQQEAQFLAALSLLILLTAIVGIAITSFFIYSPEQNARLMPVYAGLSLFLVVYFKSRRGEIYGAVSWLASVATTLIVLASLVIGGVVGREFLNYLILVTTFISVFRRVRQTIAWVMVVSSSVLIFQVLNPELSLMDLIRGPLSFNLFGSAFVVLFVSYWRIREQEKRRLLAASERERAHLLVKEHQYALLKAFVSAATHDFGTRLTIIETSRYLLNATLDGADAKAARHLGQISTAVNQLKTQLTNLNLIMTLDPAEQEEADLHVVVDRVMLTMQPAAQNRSVTLTARHPTPPIVIEASPDHLETALGQLIDNAISHTPEGGSVLVACDYANGHALISVEDTGDGISPEHLAHVFDAFYKADDARTTSRAGLGLGLTIVRLIAETYSGTVEVTSAPGQGSRFTLHLPARLAQKGFGSRVE